MKTLTLSLKRKWFDMIKAGIKKEEYRECSEYWIARFQKLCSYFEYFHAAPHNNVMRSCSGLNVDRLVFTLGYPKADDTERRLTFKNPRISIGTGRRVWHEQTIARNRRGSPLILTRNLYPLDDSCIDETHAPAGDF